jgi:hypothetical protein
LRRHNAGINAIRPSGLAGREPQTLKRHRARACNSAQRWDRRHEPAPEGAYRPAAVEGQARKEHTCALTYDDPVDFARVQEKKEGCRRALYPAAG